MRKPRVAFVVQRNGKEVNGGSEALCFSIAEKMKDLWDVEILTTCALDYITWEDYYPEGVEVINEVPVRRFKVDSPRDEASYSKYCKYIFITYKYFKPRISIEESERWMQRQGPMSSKLLNYIAETKESYDVFIFFTYLYATTYFGLPLVADKAYLVPTAHDEWPIYLPLFDQMFRMPLAHIFCTVEEKDFLTKRFPDADFKGEVVGVGIDLPENVSAERFLLDHNIQSPYILYVGRIDINKGCQELFDYFIRYKSETGNNVKLLLAGKSVMAIPQHADIIELGFIDEQTKYDAMQGCEFLINPSPFESLSIVLLEAWSLNRPTLVTEKCEVMVGQSRRSNCGLWYADYEEFKECVAYLLEHRDMATNGHTFVEDNYSWEVIREKYLRITAPLLGNLVDH